ncbi:YccF domain-containing protein [Salinibacterium sp. ZJ450]|uniref:YccF domain-containing protein n=1 Tax=Salinibacterium sp. ZJ450 TaxID=2708338 RepID=UPI0014210609|nr:YccF domain-containing protein [Salinibacterium sp. ZJ450]
MKTLLNLIWLILSGFWLFLGYLLAAVIMFVLIVTIPWGIAAARIGVYALWPFGKTVVDKPTAGIGSVLGNVVWVILAGWWLAIGHILSGIALCITIIGIPFGIANFKMVPISLLPLGKDIVDQ